MVYDDLAPDPIALSSDYNPGSYRYMHEGTYDGEHNLFFESSADAGRYYDYLLANVFNGAPAFRVMTLFIHGDFFGVYLPQFESFCNATGVPYRYYYYRSTVEGETGYLLMVAFGK